MKRLAIILFVLLMQYPIWAQNGNYAQVNGVKLYYEVHDSLEPLVLFHNFKTSLQL